MKLSAVMDEDTRKRDLISKSTAATFKTPFKRILNRESLELIDYNILKSSIQYPILDL